ncbi:MAG: TauD/TfdA family dioxygenase [Pigmentiphaga sp.]|uniref:TauD/TfdA family dioxygenase n=1 Tax=Pigmentiphaga sp. TaxID=1977564 RepID=UPI0029BBDC82|nr:TauD/TfdA family dioxygenase [Pigmentiphaga sp.]MDX3905913.1 TauD/TfdA family dioxygenase [Pigmentiphaga sp.]
MSTTTHFPSPTRAPAAWRGPDVDWTQECLFRLDDADIAEIDRALKALNAGAIERPLPLRPQDFPLERVASKLQAVGEQLYRGKGFAMLRGLPRTRYSADEMAQIYFGLSVYLGVPISQSHRGELLGHVLNLAGYGEVARAYQDGGHMNMHTDSCDIIGLMCLRTARAGGASRICSALAIHDALAEQRPDLLASLYAGYYFRRGDKDAQLGDGRKVSVAPVPVFDRLPGWPQQVSCYFLGSYIRRAAKEGFGSLSAVDQEAVATLEAMAESPEFYLDMQFQDGDIQFLNNRVILHGRTDYADEDDIGKRRHLLRVWLSAPEWPPLAPRQVMHSDEDHRLWLERRDPALEFPQAYLESLRAHAD